jgi:hypothetical protein
MKYIIFENAGLIDLLAFNTFGASVKETDNPIGMFGTGLKYAIAVILREGGTLVLQRGTDIHTFKAKAMFMRGQAVEGVYMDHQFLGFTTQLGKFWEPWQAFRELYCNAYDEEEAVVRNSNGIPEAEKNKTRFIVYQEKFPEILEQLGSYFIDSRRVPLYKGASAEIYHGESNVIFYKKVRAHDCKKPTLATYNIISNSVDLTEDRTLKYTWEIDAVIRSTIINLKDKDLLKKILTAPKDTYESSIDYYQAGFSPSDEFLETVSELRKDFSVNLNLSAYGLYLKHAKDIDRAEISAELDEVEQIVLTRSIEFLEELRFNVREYPIVVQDTLGKPNILGMAENETIFISKSAFAMGTKIVANTILEEYLHLKTRYSDCTRELQNHLFEIIISQGERLLKRPL